MGTHKLAALDLDKFVPGRFLKMYSRKGDRDHESFCSKQCRKQESVVGGLSQINDHSLVVCPGQIT